MTSTAFKITADIYGVSVAIDSSEKVISDWISEYLKPFLKDTDKASDIRITIDLKTNKSLDVPPDAEWFLHYYGLAGMTHGRYFYFRAFDSVFRFDPVESRGECVIGPEMISRRRYFTHVFFTVVLFEILRYHGLYYIHGAALAKKGGPSILIPANAHSGKSTLCVALIYNGFDYSSDDAVFARENGDGKIELLPFVREFHVSPALAARFRDLQFVMKEPEYFPGNDKRAFKGEDVFPGRFVPSIKSPDCVLFPFITDDAESRLERLSSHKALTMLIPNSALIMFSKEAAKKHLDALKKIVVGAECYRLSNARDIYESPVEAVGRLVGQLSKK